MSDIYSTTDCDLTAALLATGNCISEVERNGQGRVCFQFLDTPELRRARLQYIGGALQLNVSNFLRSRKTALDLAHGSL